MIFRLVFIVIAAMALTLGGCKKEPTPAEPAEVEVTEENLDAELDKMEQEIEADIAAEQ